MLVLTGLFFVACGGIDYSKVNLTCDQDHVTLMIGEEMTVNFTIENLQGGMSEKLDFSLQGHSVTIDASEPNNATTSLLIKGVEGGRTTIVATAEGQKSCQVVVDVLKPSQSLSNGENVLYLTESKPLSPSSIDFKFDSDAVLRNLAFHFYGISNGNTVLLENVRDGEEYINQFKKVFVVNENITESGETVKVSHIVFEDAQENFYTINAFEKSTDRKHFCQFVALTKDGDNFIFNDNHLKVYPGDKFTFVARYLDDPESQIYVQRDFYIYTNLDESSIDFNLKYLPKQEGGLEQTCDDQEKIVLIPNRENSEESLSLIDFGRVQASFSISASDMTQNLIKIEANFKDDYVANKVIGKPVFNGDKLTFPIEITSATTRSVNTTLVVRFFYEDLKNVTDKGVSFEVEVPVQIIYQPEEIIINDGNFDSNNPLVFYNTYYDDQSGWEKFNFSLNPIDAKYDEFVLNFNVKEVNIRYNGRIYSEENCEKDSRNYAKLKITDLSLPVEIRGLRQGGMVTGNGVFSSVGVTVNFNIGGMEESRTRSISYIVKSGADHIEYQSEHINETDILYMSIFDTSEKIFDAMVAKSFNGDSQSIDAEFTSFEIRHESGDDVVEILTKSKISDQGSNVQNRLQIGLKSKTLGYGVYRVTLDNGVHQVFRVQVIEELDSLKIVNSEGSNAVKLCEQIVENKTNNNDETKRSFTNNVYILHKNSSEIKFEIFANNNQLSKAISQAIIKNISANGFSATLDYDDYITLNINAFGDGSGQIELMFNSFKVADNFKQIICENTYTMDIVSYSFMDSLVIQDENGDNANYIQLFANAPRGDSKTLKVKDSTGYMFYDHEAGCYSASAFNEKFIYWQSSSFEGIITYNSGEVYIGGDDPVARFDPKTMTITPMRKGVFELYAMIDQYAQNQPKIFSIKVEIEEYIRVESISAQDTIKDIDFSLRSADRVKEVIVQVTPNGANNKNIKAIYTPKDNVNIFGEDGISVKAIDEQNGVFMVSLDASKFELPENNQNQSENNGETGDGNEGSDSENLNRVSLGGSLMIAPVDWLNDNDILIYDGGTVNIDINFQTGDEKNPYILRTADDVIAIKEDLSAYYSLATTIDISNKQEELPLGVFSGHLTGITEDAKITGINVRKGSAGKYNEHDVTDYGLFSQIAKGAVIKDVAFAGKFDIDNENDNKTGRRMGIVAGLNSGTLENIGVELTDDSTIKPKDISNGDGLRLGGVVGGNEGTIVQGHLPENQNNEENARETQDENKSSIKPKITFYSGKYKIKIDASVLEEVKDENLIKVRVGGLVGRNQGDIIKTSENDGLGYANYMAYTNIEVINQNPKVFNIGDDIGGLVGVSEEGSIYSENENSPIIVGGRLSGNYAVGGIAGKIAVKENYQLKNITSRTFVKGSYYVGGISAKVNNQIGVDAVNFTLQAVDAGGQGFDASMIVKNVIEKSERTTKTSTETETKPSIQKIAFGDGFSSITSEIKALSYVKDVANDISGTETQNSRKYFGDYIEIKQSANDSNAVSIDGYYVATQVSFNKDNDSINVSANKQNGFGEFTNNKNNLFYMFYFGANSLNINDNNDTFSKVQETLNNEYNTQKSDDKLYPITSENNEIVFSTNSNILSIDHSGTISVTGTGVATIECSSILNSSQSMTIKIYVTNYFNHSKDISIVYPSMSQTSLPLVDGSVANVKGDNVVRQYVRPNYELKDKDEKIVSTQFGNMLVDNVSISLVPNTAISAEMEYEDNADANIFDISCSGQTITLKRKSSLHEDKEIYVTVKPFINVDGDVSYVNKEFSYTVNYKKGAISIKTVNYEQASITTGQTLNDVIVINSTAKEDCVNFKIYDSRGRDVLSSGEENKNRLFSASILDSKGNSVMNASTSDLPDTASSDFNFAEQKFSLSVYVDTTSYAYQNRFEREIYGTYYMEITAGSDSSVTTVVELRYINIPLNNVVIDNYNSRPKANESLTSTSNVSYPGREGVLALTLSPDTADFDYILIENDLSNDQEGNGRANIGLLTKNSQGEPFNNSQISGSVTERGIKLTFNEILEAYSSKDVEKYHGVIYLRYVISSLGVKEGGNCVFRITAVKENSFTKTYLKKVDLVIQNHVYLSLEGKTSTSQDISKPVFEVARGLKYRINIDKYGFTDDEIEITTEVGDPVAIVKENGQYFVQVLSNISYNGATFKDVKVKVQGKSEDGTRVYESEMTLTIREYNILYNNLTDKNSDIIRGMNNGRINLNIGNPFNLRVDFESFIEFDSTDPTVVGLVQEFIESLQNSATWMVYTNLNGSVSSGESLKDNFENARDIFDFSRTNNAWPKLETNYFTSDGLRFTPIMTHTFAQRFYAFTFKVNFKNVGGGKFEGVAFSQNANDSQPIETTFTFDVTTSSSLEHPIPIYEQDELMNMTEGSHYILMKDIELNPETFQPINANFKSFDGNGYTISFVGKDGNNIYYDFGNESNIGLFSTIDSGTVVKNLNVKIGGGVDDTSDNINDRKLMMFKTSSTAFNAGVIAGQNNGIITNCYVYSEEDAGKFTYLTVSAGGANSNGYIAGIAGTNGGFITNSRSSLYAMSAYYNLSGFVGINNGKIASSYFKDGVLVGSSTDRNVAGFVINNGSSGQIITSYVSGEKESSHLLVKDRNEKNPKHFIRSSTNEGGFAFTNQGLIENCYSNIRILGSSQRAGFVFRNEGQVKKSFSLSILENDSISSAGFAMDFSDGAIGTFEDCYYIEDEEYAVDVNGNQTNVKYYYNTHIKPISFEGVTPLTIDGFSDYKTYFSNYIYTDAKNAGGVWVIADGKLDSAGLFGNTIATGGLELVSANIIAHSRQSLLSREEDSSSGDVVYTYKHESNGAGEIKNPYIIFDANSFEYYLASDTTKVVDENVRLVADIDYQEFETNSKTYRTIFNGVLEGNGMEIRNIRLISTERLTSAGLFSQIGQNATASGQTVMNLTLSPKTVSFASTTSVGALAGLVSNGKIYNVSITSSGNDLTVIGNNFVGGLFGRTQGVNNMKNISSTVSVTANFKPEFDFQYREGYGNETSASYAGSLIGFAGENTTIVKAYASEIGTILGDRAGYMFGGIGSESNISYVYADINLEAKIRANHYGGMVAGETQGTLSEVDVYGNESEVSIFAVEPGFVPVAVGGIAGRINGGKLSNIIMSQSFIVGSYQTSSSSVSVNYVGGLVGYSRVSDVRIENSIMSANISTSGSVLGGAVGLSDQSVNLDRVAVENGTLALSGQTSSVSVGGLVGSLIDNGKVNISNSYCNSSISVDIFAHRVDMTASVSGLVAYNAVSAVMQNCYSTSSINVIMRDISAIGVTKKGKKQEKALLNTNESVFTNCKVTENLSANNNNMNLIIYNYGKPQSEASENPPVSAYKPSLAGLKDHVLIGGGNSEIKGVNVYHSTTSVKEEIKNYIIENEKLTHTYIETTGTGDDKKEETKKKIKDSIEFLDKRFVLYEKGDIVAVATGEKDTTTGKPIVKLQTLGDEYIGKYIECTNQNVVWYDDGANKNEYLEMTVSNLNSILVGNPFPERTGCYLFFETNLFWQHK
jgi:hypothetical protein